MLVDHALEQFDGSGVRGRDRRIGIFGQKLDRRARKPVALDAALENAEAPLAARRDLQEPELRHVPGGDARRGAHVGGRGGRAHLRAFANQAHAERALVFHAAFRHLQVALLEDAQRQPAAGKQNRAQRKEGKMQRQVFYGVPSSVRPRWRTSTFQSPRNVSASFSARYTERWRPPVQPIATVTWLRFSRAISGSQRASSAFA